MTTDSDYRIALYRNINKSVSLVDLSIKQKIGFDSHSLSPSLWSENANNSMSETPEEIQNHAGGDHSTEENTDGGQTRLRHRFSQDDQLERERMKCMASAKDEPRTQPPFRMIQGATISLTKRTVHSIRERTIADGSSFSD